MRPIKLRILVFAAVLSVPLVLCNDHEDASAGSYSPCYVPSTIGSSVKPNILFVIDYSGSMQGPAHFDPGPFQGYDTGGSQVADYHNEDATGIYDRYKDYTGYYDTNRYYTYNPSNDYFTESSAKPPTAYTFQVDKIRVYKQQEAGVDVYYCQVWTQTSFQNKLQVNDPICFENVTRKEFLTKNSWSIMAINTGTYKDLTFALKPKTTYTPDPVDGTPDSGNVFKRVSGSFSNGYYSGTTTLRYTPVSGNVINYLTATRYDNQLRALMGGKGDATACPSGTDCYGANPPECCYVLMRPQGGRFYQTETSGLRCTADVTPNNVGLGLWVTKYTTMTIASQVSGRIDPTSSPQSAHRSCYQTCPSPNYCKTCTQSSSVCGQNLRTEVWTFTLTEATRIDIEMGPTGSGTLMGDPFLKVYSGATPSGTPVICDDDSGTGLNARILTNLAPGTYSLEATTWNGVLGNGMYVLTSNVELLKGAHANHNGVRGVEWVGSITNAACKLRKLKSQRSGIIQQNFGKARLGFIMFRGNPQESTAGKIMVPLSNTSVDVLVDALQGHYNATAYSLYKIDYSSPSDGAIPVNGTPTGEALQEAMNYLKQSGLANWNSQFNKLATVQDPYYTLDYRGTSAVATPCRKSFVVLISDGVWSPCMKAGGTIDKIDPVVPAHLMHTQDLRSTMAGDQKANVYSLYAFGEEPQGMNSMKEVAMYGGFQDKDSNGYPYPRTGFPAYQTTGGLVCGSGEWIEDRSCNLRWPLVECCKCPTLAEVQNSTCSWKNSISACGSCDASNQSCLASLCPYPDNTYRSSASCSGCECSACGQYNEEDNGQCQEWATKKYQETTYTRGGVRCGFQTLHGEPRNYYKANDAAEMQDALNAIMSDITQQTGAAGSVATVSQKYQGEDLVVRAAFEAADPDKSGAYKWYGHLETYIPFQYAGEYQYDFEMPCNAWKYDADGNPKEVVFCRDMPGDSPGACHRPATCWDASAGYPQMLKELYGSGSGDTNRRLLTATHYYDSGMSKWLTPTWTTASTTWAFADVPKWADISGSTDDKNKWGQLLNTSTDTETENLIYWIRGSGVAGLRDRGGNILGDIVYSTPVVVGSAPAMGIVASEDPDYAKYLVFRQSWVAPQKTANKPSSTPTTAQKLKKMVYVGANDGMIHAFILGVWDWDNQTWIYTPGDGAGQDSDIGKELWSYIPSNLLSQMKCLAETADSAKEYAVDSGCNHRYMVDLAPTSFQVYMASSDCKTDVNRDGSYTTGLPCGSGPDYRTDCVIAGTPPAPVNDGKCWRTIIVGGERGGGDLYFAIDVTDPGQPKLLWEFSMIKDLVQFDLSSGTKFRTPVGITGQYDLLKILPMSWSRPHVGRLTLPTTGTYYVGNPASETLTIWPGSLTSLSDSEKGDRHFVFVGGGFRIFQETLDSVAGTSLAPALQKSTLDVMRKPRFLAIDVETGKNVLRYLWPYMIERANTDFPAASGKPAPFDPPKRPESCDPSTPGSCTYVPFAMGDPTVQDFWDLYQCARPRTDSHFPGCQSGAAGSAGVGTDGYVDHIYIGDMNGYFYSIKFVNFSENSTGTPGIWVDVRPTKGLDETTYHSTWPWSNFRSRGTPVTTQPSVSIDLWDETSARVIFGAGKYDDTTVDPNDKTDPAKMALYNLKDSMDLSSITIDASKVLSGTGISVWMNLQCIAADSFFDIPTRCTYFGGAKYSDVHDTAKCKWAKSCTTDATTGSRSCEPDCCQSSNSTCTGTVCWNCIYDLTKPDSTTQSGAAGERITTKPLIAGGLVFVTSYVPSTDPCLPQGLGYLYAFNYTCSVLPDGFTPFTPVDNPTPIYGTTTDYMLGQVLTLGAGVPSAPVLDSSGKKVIIQMSDGTIRTVDVNLLIKRIQVKGWRERTK